MDRDLACDCCIYEEGGDLHVIGTLEPIRPRGRPLPRLGVASSMWGPTDLTHEQAKALFDSLTSPNRSFGGPIMGYSAHTHELEH